MASTRNRNTQGDYNLEQSTFENQRNYIHYLHSSSGQAIQTMYPSNGLGIGRVAASNLSHNPEDIESYLFGIGSTNLVSQKPDTTPEFRNLKHLSIADRMTFILPELLVVDKDQRNLWT